MSRQYVLRVRDPVSRVLTAEPGALTASASAADVRAMRRILADPGALALAGTDATLTYGGATPTWAGNRPTGLTTLVDTQFAPADFPAGIEQYSPTGDWKYIGDVDSETSLSSGNGSEYGPNCIRCPQPGNDAGNGIGTSTVYDDGITPVRQLYLSLEVFVPSYYVTHSVSEKFWYPYRVHMGVGGDGGGGNMTGWHPADDEPEGDHIAFELQPQNGLDPPTIFQSSSVYLTKGVNNLLEIYQVMNTPGSANGVWRIWVDGVLAVDETGVRYSSWGSQDAWNVWAIDDTRGSGTSSVLTPAGGQFREYSRMQVAGSTSLP